MKRRLAVAGLAIAGAAVPAAAGRPSSTARIELGRRLFYDADPSIDGTLSCAGYHEQRRGLSDGNSTHPGVRGSVGRRNVPGLANVGDFSVLTWADPDQTSLEGQIATPIFGEHPVEMGMRGQSDEIVRRLSADACYRQMFAAAFPADREAIRFDNVELAIAAFERTFVSKDSPYDRFQRGERLALGADARAGLNLFRRKGYARCHAGPDFTDGRFHAVAPTTGDDPGLAEKTGLEHDRGAFRTPSLRNVGVTGPYLHDGSKATVTGAIAAHSPAASVVSAEEAGLIVEFLGALTDEPFLRRASLALPRMVCGAARLR